MKAQTLRSYSFPLAAGLILLFFGVRVWFVASGQLNLVQDEAQYWDWTRHLQLTYYSKGPLLTWFIALSTQIFGNTELGVRFVSIFLSTCTQIALYYYISTTWRRPDVAVVTLLIFNTVPVFFGISMLCTTDMPFTFFWVVGLFSLYQASLPQDRTGAPGRAPLAPFIPLTLAFGLGVLAKYTMLGFLGLAVFYGFILQFKGLKPAGFWRKLSVALILGLIIGFLPTFIWNYQNDFVGYKHVFYLIGVEGKQAGQLIRFDRFPDYIGSQVGLATPWWLIFMLVGGTGALFKTFAGAPQTTLFNDRPSLDVRQSALLSVFFWPIWLFFLAWSFHAKVMPNWTTVGYVAGVILAAYCFLRVTRRFVFYALITVLVILLAAALVLAWNSVPWGVFAPLVALPALLLLLRRQSKAYLFLFSLLFFGFVLSLPQIPFPPDQDPFDRLKGWDDLGGRIAQAEDQDFGDPNKVFVFSDLYDMTAALSFYVPGQKQAYCAWIDDRRMNQYDLWPGPQDKIGWDAVFVRKRFYDAPHSEVLKMFDRVIGPIQYQSTFNGRPARKFTLYYCYDYNGYWPRHEGSF